MDTVRNMSEKMRKLSLFVGMPLLPRRVIEIKIPTIMDKAHRPMSREFNIFTQSRQAHLCKHRQVRVTYTKARLRA